MTEKKKIKLPIIVEGRYDKNTLSQIFSATIVTTGGFSVFNSKEKQDLIKKLAKKGGIILLTDSDAGGKQIRSFLSGILPKEQIFNVYIPEINGKEKRKNSPSKSGLLGVEGMERQVLEKALAKFIDTGACNENSTEENRKMLTKVDFYSDGLSGKENSSALRRALSKELDLPSDMTANALLEAINLLYSYEDYKCALNKITQL